MINDPSFPGCETEARFNKEANEPASISHPANARALDENSNTEEKARHRLPVMPQAQYPTLCPYYDDVTPHVIVPQCEVDALELMADKLYPDESKMDITASRHATWPCSTELWISEIEYVECQCLSNILTCISIASVESR